jgi:hypothetical protein
MNDEESEREARLAAALEAAGFKRTTWIVSKPKFCSHPGCACNAFGFVPRLWHGFGSHNGAMHQWRHWEYRDEPIDSREKWFCWEHLHDQLEK